MTRAAVRHMLLAAVFGVLLITMASPMRIVAASAATIADAGQAPPNRPRFEVASIKPCKPENLAPGARSGSKGPSPSPGRLHMDCVPLVGSNGLIRRAYGAYASGQYKANLHSSALPIEGGPEWITREFFTIDAKAETAATPPAVEMMVGPMLQTLLEDRFHLKVRRETRPVPVYELTVAKNGSKLKPFNNRCKPVDFSKGSLVDQIEAEGACAISMHDNVIDAPGETIPDFISFALTLLDRPVVDKTGLTGRFDIHVDLPGDDGAALDLTSKVASVLPNQLGLRLESATGPGDVLIIDHVERPTPNDAFQMLTEMAEAMPRRLLRAWERSRR